MSGLAVQTGNDGTTPGLLDRSRRVLVVEDDPGLCDAVVRLARGFGADVSQAQRLDDAFRLLEEGPDLLIADLRIEDKSAFPLIEAAVGRRPPPAVVAMSGQASVEESFRLGRLGVRAYLAKPFGSDALLAAVERATRDPAEVALRVAVEAGGPAGDDARPPPPQRGIRGLLGRLLRLPRRG